MVHLRKDVHVHKVVVTSTTYNMFLVVMMYMYMYMYAAEGFKCIVTVTYCSCLVISKSG